MLQQNIAPGTVHPNHNEQNLKNNQLPHQRIGPHQATHAQCQAGGFAIDRNWSHYSRIVILFEKRQSFAQAVTHMFFPISVGD